MGIRLKLLLPPLLALALFALVLEWFVLPSFIEKERLAHIQQQENNLDVLGISLVEPLLQANLGQVHAALDAVLERQQHWQQIILKNARGELLYPLDPATLQTGENIIHVSHRITHLNQALGSITLTSDINEIIEEYVEAIRQIQLLLLLIIVVAEIVVMLLQDRLIRTPLNQLVTATRSIADGNFQTKLPPGGQDEIGKLIDSFSKMRSSLMVAQDALRKDAREARESEVRQQKESEHYMVSLLDNIDDGIISLDIGSHIKSINQSAEKLFGYSKTEAFGLHVSTLLPHWAQLQKDHGLHTVGKTYRLETQARDIDGRFMDIGLTISNSIIRGDKVQILVIRHRQQD